MKKEFLSISLYKILILIGICIIGIIIGSFSDLNISNYLYNKDSLIGSLVETILLFFGYMMIPIGGCLVFLGLYKRNNIFIKILGYFLGLLSIGLCTYFYGHSLIEGTNKFGYRLNIYLSYFIALFLTIIAFIVTYFNVKKNNYNQLLKIGLVIVISMLLQYLLIELLKSIASRPRYRFLINDSLNTDNIIFKNWYEFTPFTATNDFFKSWPSGHTATATQLILLTSLTPVLKSNNKNIKTILFSIGIFYTVFIAFYRIVYGAHFLSDVSFGFLFALLIILVLILIFEKIPFEKQKNNSNS